MAPSLGSHQARSGMDAQELNLNLNGYGPVCSIVHFAQLVGLPERVVREQVSKGYWPTYGKVGKYVMINLAAIQAQCLHREAVK